MLVFKERLKFAAAYWVGGMVINTQDTNYSIGGMVINTQDTNYSIFWGTLYEKIFFEDYCIKRCFLGTTVSKVIC